MSSSLQELTIRCPLSLADVLVSALFDAGATGVEERTAEGPTKVEYDEDAETIEHVHLVVYSDNVAQLDVFQQVVTQVVLTAPDQTTNAVAFERHPVVSDWENEWLRHLRPVPLGDAFVVQPLGDTTPLPQGRRTIRLRPTWAFGDGSHPTTQLAGESVERFCREHPGGTVLDVGTGSGVLGFVAVASGASRAQLIDVAPEAVAAATENAELNEMSDQCSVSNEPLSDMTGPFDLVVCNINESTLLMLANDLVRLTAPQGQLAITGLVTGETVAVEGLLHDSGMRVVRRDELREWVLIEMKR